MRRYDRYIIIKFQFPAIHNWEKCNIEEVDFLKYPHRHIFHGKARAWVFHNNRQIEFISLKRKVEKYITEKYRDKELINVSCEMIAEDISNKFEELFMVEIYEDNENGGGVVERIEI